ncbi:MAG: flagellar filament capping protein FliD [Bdellovibrionales bacterium]|nr:flagellar filament capping protein FliD [Bdellovibrionales bacterium]
MPLINFSGIASGIDSEALIEATLEADRNTQINPSQDRITKLQETNTALEEVKTRLTTFQSTLRSFSSLFGGGLFKGATSTDESNVIASAASTAKNGTYTINVTQLAENAVYTFQSTAGTYTSSSAAIAAGINDGDPAANRTVSIAVGDSSTETVDIVVTSTMTLTDFANEFNNNSSRASASVVNVGTSSSPDYRIVVNSNKTGLDEGSINVTVGTSVSGQSAFDNNSEDPALNSTFTIDGISGTITRQSNKVSDVIPGVSFEFVSTGSATISVSDDVESTKSAVSDLVDQFNDIITYIAENNKIERVEDGEEVENIFGPLAETRVDDGVITALKSNMSSASYALGSSIKIFADIGITTERDGTLKFDEDVFEAAMASEPTSVNQILTTFADTASLTGGTIDTYIRFNGLLDVTINGNDSLIENLNDRISRAEASLARKEESMRLRFARLESLIGSLQQQQSALSSALAGLQGG